MLTPAEHALIRKDFLEIWSSKMARATLIAVPIGLVVVVPALFLAAVCLVPLEQAAGIQEMLSLLPSHLQHYNAQQGLFYLLTNTLFPLFFLMVPLMASAVSASCIFAGEKERRTIETLLLTPLRVRQIFRAKLACCLSLSFATTAISFGAFTIVASVGDIMLGMSFFLNWSWLVIILLLSPGLMVFGAVFMVFAFNRTSSRIESFQTVAYVALPFLLLYIAPFTGLFRVNATVLLLAAAVVWLCDLFLWIYDRRTFLPEKFLNAPLED